MSSKPFGGLELNKDLIWIGDNNGDEVGYPELNVVGLYAGTGANEKYHYMLDMDNSRIIEKYLHDLDEED